MYPTISAENARRLRDDYLELLNQGIQEPRASGELESLLGEVAEHKAGADFDEHLFWETSASIRDDMNRLVGQFEKTTGIDQRLGIGEIFVGGRLHKALREFEIAARADKGFWRWLSLGPMFWFVRWREPELQDQDIGAMEGSVRYWLLVRAYLAGHLAYDESNPEDPYHLLRFVETGSYADFWHSHVARPTYHHQGIFSQTFIGLAAPPVEKDVAREFAKQVKRTVSGHAIRLLDDDSIKIELDRCYRRAVESQQ